MTSPPGARSPSARAPTPPSEDRARFTEAAARHLARAIQDADGHEVFAIGDLDAEGRVAQVEVHARGMVDTVVALFKRVRPGQVVIHNHPSGDLRPSAADMAVAGRYGDDGIGVVIVSNDVARDHWVVEPVRLVEHTVDPEVVRAFFEDTLARRLPGYEVRPAQVEMALEVCAVFNRGGSLVAEAGTGTGKSLAYLVPAVFWAEANHSRVVVSTYTRTLQDQLTGSDLPLLQRAGLSFTAAAVKGRNNYVCRRKLAAAWQEEAEEGALWSPPATTGGGAPAEDPRALLTDLVAWAETAGEGTRADLPFPVPPDLWERVESDRLQTLRLKCPHYERCFYYTARRRAASAQVVVVNHSLLLSDLALKKDTNGYGLLPAYSRVVLDEAHHLEDAATSVGAARLSLASILHTLGGLLPGRRRPGVLERVRVRFGGLLSPVPAPRQRALQDGLEEAFRLGDQLRTEARFALESVAWSLGLQDHACTLPTDPAAPPAAGEGEEGPPALEEATPPGGNAVAGWKEPVSQLAQRLAELSRCLGALESRFEGVTVPEGDVQLLLDLRKAQVRMAEHAAVANRLLQDDAGQCRWAEPGRRREAAELLQAPIDVGPLLGRILYGQVQALVLTSATVSVAGDVGFFLDRWGLRAWNEATPPDDPDAPRGLRGTLARVWPSPFDFSAQVLLGLPRELPEPNRSDWTDAVATFVNRALAATGGGAFVLCTSFQQVNALADAAEQALGTRMTILRQKDGGRRLLLDRFREDRDSVLFGTDSFWEGVSVKGDALRLVIIPKLPFDVPTEPLAQARQARVVASGADPFRTFTLPRAVLRLRQGFGRLVRAHSDHGAVLLLDRRLHDRWYGRAFLAALPPARRVVGPNRAVLQHLRGFFEARGLPTGEGGGDPG